MSARVLPKQALLVLGVGFAAALCGHVVIDVLGDYVLAHDTYDDIGHGSRALLALVTLIAVALGIGWTWRAVVREARGSENALCNALRAALPRNVPAFLILAAASATLVLGAMEAGDAIVASQPIDDLGDLFGGSIALGATVILLLTFGIGLATLAGLRWLAGRRLIAGIVRALLRRAIGAAVAWRAEFLGAVPPVARTGDICHRIAGRAPPLRSR